MTDPIILTHEQHLNEIMRTASQECNDQWTVDRLLRDFFRPDSFEADLQIIRECMERV